MAEGYSDSNRLHQNNEYISKTGEIWSYFPAQSRLYIYRIEYCGGE